MTTIHSPQKDTTVPEYPVPLRWIEGVERLDKYQPGGYHPVEVDDLIHHRYRIVDKLGFGGYSTIWLAHDIQLHRYVALKVGISGSSFSNHESVILRDLSASDKTKSAALPMQRGPNHTIPEVLDEFDIQGPNGTHPCYVSLAAQGSLAQAQGHSHIFPIQIARALVAKLILAVAFVHSQGYSHGDINLNNVLIGLLSSFDDLSVTDFRKKYGDPEIKAITRIDRKPLPPNCPAQAVVPLYLGKRAYEFELTDVHHLLISDFGEAFAPSQCERFGKDSHAALAMRAPEAHFEPRALLSYPSDIWSLGVAIWEILGMKCLFSKEETNKDVVVAEQIEVLGYDTFPPSWLRLWRRSTLDEPQLDERERIPRQPVFDRDPWPSLEDAFFEFIQSHRVRLPERGAFDKEEVKPFLNLTRGMLQFSPRARLTMDEILQDEWVMKWALPALRSGDDR